MNLKPKLHLGLPQGQNYGWGVCGFYLHKELPTHFEILPLDMGKRASGDFDGTLFQALEGQNLAPWFNGKAKPNIGYVFFEDELDAKSLENSRQCDLILGGSTWCCNKMTELGIRHADVLLQGIDPDLFYPIEQPLPDDKFIIFSGGKFEFRKGQDLVLAAFKALQDKYKDMHLLTAWSNSWGQSLQTMQLSPYIQFDLQGETWPAQLHYLCVKNGIDPARVQACPLVPSRKMRGIFARTHVGIFPNRCEGGTNLVLMEYMACGKTAIASSTSGHLDILQEGNAIPLTDLHPCRREYKGKWIWKWEEPRLDSIIAAIEYAYQNREKLPSIGGRASECMKKFTWAKMASNIYGYVQKIGI